ncbi:MAG TPA: methyl-accepting chemotaxis protein [Phycisphaerae bacterium]|nr:methyl-accepting chemotaxis protein [Phycisphaerae bacterium]
MAGTNKLKTALIGSFRFRVLFCSVGAMVLTLVVTLMVGGIGMYHELEKNALVTIKNHVNFMAHDLNSYNDSCVAMVRTLAMCQEDGMFGRREETARVLQTIMRADEDIYDLYVIYEPNADGQDEKYRNRPNHDATGRMNNCWYRRGGQIDYSPGVDMETSLYYRGCKEQFLSGSSRKYMITEPYLYEGTLMYEITYPIVVNNKFVGIVGSDTLLDRMAADLRRRKQYESTEFLLLSAGGRIIACTDRPEYLTKTLDETPYAQLLTVLKDNVTRDEVLKAKVGDTDDYYACASVPVGGWTLFMKVHSSDVLGGVHDMLLMQMIISIILVIILCVALAVVINSMLRPIFVATDVAQKVAQGDLREKPQITGSGEAAVLLHSIRDMTDNLGSVVRQVQKTGVQVGASATEIFASTSQLEATTFQQVQFADKVLETSKKISDTSSQLATTMSGVSSIAEKARHSAETSADYLERMEQTITQMEAASTAISQKLSRINEKAGNINEIIKTINQVAEQTNLLSLNAAIEAEKAGEYGLGFAVVAREVRKLADQTSSRVRDIRRVIEEMQSAVSTGVMEMDKFTQEVTHGVKEAGIVGEKLGEIIEQVQEITPKFEMVNTGMQDQSLGAVEIADAVSRLHEGARQINQALSEFKNVTQQLKDEASNLRDEIAKFKV